MKDLIIRKVENGFILNELASYHQGESGKQFVFENTADLGDFIGRYCKFIIDEGEFNISDVEHEMCKERIHSEGVLR